MLVLLEDVDFKLDKKLPKKYYIDLNLIPNEEELKEIELIMDVNKVNFILRYTPELFKLIVKDNVNAIYLSKNNKNKSTNYMKCIQVEKDVEDFDLIKELENLKHVYNWDRDRDSTKYEYLHVEDLSDNSRLISIKDKISNNKYLELIDSQGEIIFSKSENEILSMLNLL